MGLLTSFVAVAGVASVANAVIVTPGSPCEMSCGNVLTSTEPDDLVCQQESYDDVEGELFKTCVECEMRSNYSSDGQTDVQWSLVITYLQAGCEQQPEPGIYVAVKGNVFSTDEVEVIDPTPQVTVDPDWFDQGPLDVGAKAGIVAGGIVILLMLSGCVIVWRGKRRRRAFLRSYEPGKSNMKSRAKVWPSPLQVQGMREVGDTPLSQKPLRTWDESPVSTNSDQAFPRYFSPYSSQFSSPINTTDAQQQAQWAGIGGSQVLQQHQQQNLTKNIGFSLGSDDSSVGNSTTGKDKGESYEMQNVDRGNNGDDRYSSPSSDQQSYFTHSRTYSGSYRSFPGKRESGV
ncbi:hypothetical protein ACO1O0_009054 [Amphichorda felina]